ncbi:hypothetical protein D7147_25285 [Micromonospora musae]|uniref:Uncharacterized protein n=1 Tax=Micromonospora musae TaxID=1894970 RepID=A0A3A9XVD1_9ACTN|nr:hypothetical protein D7147_25285 [Micromonospora musae]RKN29215.1 hypothetical protein D7044_23750 [Micromonospora musae]
MRRLPNDSMVVAFFAGARVADVVRVRAGAFFAAFFAAARVAGAFFGGAFFAVAAFAVGRRVGVAVVAEVLFFRATRAVVVVGFAPGDLAALAPVARFVAAVAFFAAALRFIGAFFAPVALRAPVGRLPGGTEVLPAVILAPPQVCPESPATGDRPGEVPSVWSAGSSRDLGGQTPDAVRRGDG